MELRQALRNVIEAQRVVAQYHARLVELFSVVEQAFASADTPFLRVELKRGDRSYIGLDRYTMQPEQPWNWTACWPAAFWASSRLLPGPAGLSGAPDEAIPFLIFATRTAEPEDWLELPAVWMGVVRFPDYVGTPESYAYLLPKLYGYLEPEAQARRSTGWTTETEFVWDDPSRKNPAEAEVDWRCLSLETISGRHEARTQIIEPLAARAGLVLSKD